MNRNDAKFLCNLLEDKPFLCTGKTITVRDDFDSDGYVIMRESYYKELIAAKNIERVFG